MVYLNFRVWGLGSGFRILYIYTYIHTSMYGYIYIYIYAHSYVYMCVCPRGPTKVFLFGRILRRRPSECAGDLGSSAWRKRPGQSSGFNSSFSFMRRVQGLA